MKKVILTNKRLKRLDNEISIDDILYAKFDAMMREISKREERFFRKKHVVEVRGRDKDGEFNFVYKLQVLNEIRTPNGIIVEIKLPKSHTPKFY